MLKNLLHQAVSSATAVFLLLLFILAGRILGTESLGRFSLALAIAFIFEAVVDPGLYQITIRDLARNPQRANQYLSNILGYKILVAALILAGAAVVLALNPAHPETSSAILLLLFASALKSIKTSFVAGLHAMEYFQWDAVSQTIERLGLLCVGALVLISGGGLVGLCIAFVAVRSIDVMAAGLIVWRKVSRFAVRVDMALLVRLLRSALPVGIFLAVLNLYAYVDTLMIAAIRDDAEVGWYNAGFKIYEGLSAAALIIANVFRPRIASAFTGDSRYFAALFPLGLKYTWAVALLIALMGVPLAEMAIVTLFGSEFLEAAAVLEILLIGLPFFFAVTYFQMMSVAMDKQKTVLFIAVIGLGANVAMNLVLIPAYGYLGAAYATILGEGIVFLSFLIYLVRDQVSMQLWRSLVIPVVVIGLAIATFLLASPVPQLLLRSAIAGACFLIFAAILGVVKPSEAATLRGAEQHSTTAAPDDGT